MKSTFQPSPLDKQLRRARRTWIVARLVRGGLHWAVFAFALWLGIFLLDNAAALPGGLLLFGGSIGVVATVWSLVAMVWRPVRHLWSLEECALHLETRHGLRRNLLINALQLPRHPHTGPTATFVRHTVGAAERTAERLPLRSLWDAKRLRPWGLTVLLLMLAWRLYDVAAPLHLRNAAARFAHPLSNVQPLGRVQIHVTPARNCVVLPGDDLQVFVCVEADLRAGGGDELLGNVRPQIVVRPGATAITDREITAAAVRMVPVRPDALRRMRGEGSTSRSESGPAKGMVAPPAAWLDLAGARIFRHTIEDIRHDLSFRVFAPSLRSSGPSLHVAVTALPQMVASRFEVIPPPYTGRPPRTLAGPPDSLVGLAGSRYRVELALSGPVEQIFWEAGGPRVPFTRGTSAGWDVAGRLQTPGTYRITARLPRLEREIDLARGNRLLLDDRPPYVAIGGKARYHELIAGQTLEVDVLAADDLGIAELGVDVRTARGARSESVTRWTFDSPPGHTGTLQRTLRLPLLPSRFPAGHDYLLEAVCRDFNPTNPVTRSTPLMVRVTAPRGTHAPADDPAAQAAREAIGRAIEAQQQALTVSRNMRDYLDDILGAQRADPANPNAYVRHAATLADRQRQVDVHVEAAMDSARTIADPESRLATFLDGIRVYALRQARDQIAALGHPDQWVTPSPPLVAEGTFAATQRVATLTFDTCTGRYAVVQFTTEPQTGQLCVAEVEFLDGGGLPLPRGIVRAWHMAPVTNTLVGGRLFPRLRGDDIRIIHEAALSQKAAPVPGSSANPASLQGTTPRAGTIDYLARTIQTPTGRRIVLHCRTAAAMRIWLNEWLVAETAASADGVPAVCTTHLDLQAGKNALVLELAGGQTPPTLVATLLEPDESRRLALSREGRLHPVAEWRVLHAQPYAKGASPSAVLDEDPSTFWCAVGSAQPGLIVDMGDPQVVAGVRFRLLPQRHPHCRTACALMVADTLVPETKLTPRIKTLVRLQELILDRLSALRGRELARVQHPLAAGTQPGKNESPGDPHSENAADLVARASEYLDELAQYQAASRAASEVRDTILDAAPHPAEAEQRRLEAIKREEQAHAARLTDALARFAEQPPDDSPARRELQQDMLNDSHTLAGLADRKAGLSATDRTTALDRDIDALCKAIRNSGQALAEARAQERASQGDSGEATKGGDQAPGQMSRKRLDDRVSDLDRRQHALADDVASAASAISRRTVGQSPADAGRAIVHGQNSADGDGVARRRSDEASRAEAGRSGPADGRATGGAMEAAADAAASPTDTGRPDARGNETVRDTAADTADAATGHGTPGGTGEPGDSGPPGATSEAGSVEVAAKQRAIREAARRMLNDFRAQGLPAGDLTRAIDAMRRVESALGGTNAAALRNAYDDAGRHLSGARRRVSAASGVRFLEGVVPESAAGPLHTRARARPPEAYGEMVGAYFRALAAPASADDAL